MTPHSWRWLDTDRPFHEPFQRREFLGGHVNRGTAHEVNDGPTITIN